MSIAWTLLYIALAITLTIREARHEKREFIKRNGMTRKQLIRTCKHMRGEKGETTYRELFQNINNN